MQPAPGLIATAKSRRVTRSPRRRTEERWWRGEAKCPQRSEVDNRLVFGWHLHRQIGGLCASQNAIDIRCGRPKMIRTISSVAHEPSGSDGERSEYTAGKLSEAASLMIRSRWRMVLVSGGRTRPLFGRRANAAITRSMSLAVAPTAPSTSSMPSDVAAVRAGCR